MNAGGLRASTKRALSLPYLVLNLAHPFDLNPHNVAVSCENHEKWGRRKN
jgi:hypothetical protein